MSADQPEQPVPTTQEDPADETKRRFREALAAKQGRHGEDHLDGSGKSGGHAHGQMSGKRTFRRKTG